MAVPNQPLRATRIYGRPTKTFTPNGLLVALYVPEAEETKGGIVLPQGVEDPDKTPIGEVIAVGNEVKLCKEGDRVFVHEAVRGHFIHYRGNRYFMVREEQISGILNPE